MSRAPPDLAETEAAVTSPSRAKIQAAREEEESRRIYSPPLAYSPPGSSTAPSPPAAISIVLSYPPFTINLHQPAALPTLRQLAAALPPKPHPTPTNQRCHATGLRFRPPSIV
ncbi:hypothetical protein Dimus_003560, partial [Dionaea muscipula]